MVLSGKTAVDAASIMPRTLWQLMLATHVFPGHTWRDAYCHSTRCTPKNFATERQDRRHDVKVVRLVGTPLRVMPGCGGHRVGQCRRAANCGTKCFRSESTAPVHHFDL